MKTLLSLILASLFVCAAKSQGATVTVLWLDNSTNETGFIIERAPAAPSTAFAEVGRVAANVTTYTDATVSTSTSYQYRIKAFNATDASAYSNIGVITTRSGVNAPSGASASQPVTIALAPNSKAIISAGAIAGYNQSAQKVNVYASDQFYALSNTANAVTVTIK